MFSIKFGVLFNLLSLAASGMALRSVAGYWRIMICTLLIAHYLPRFFELRKKSYSSLKQIMGITCEYTKVIKLVFIKFSKVSIFYLHSYFIQDVII